MTATTYRPDIDGLRAIAVLGVLAYHFQVGPLNGGFLGVDIFFCISGYLITGILIEDFRASRFSFTEFIERRIRRLFPALFAVMAAVLVATIFIFPPDRIEGVGGSVAAAAVYLSNIYFYQTTDYFSDPAETIPLLHTWSLAVEEQYYLIWPILLLALFRLFARGDGLVALLAGVAVLLCAAFGYSLNLASRDELAAFYLLQGRAWELLCGGVLAT